MKLSEKQFAHQHSAITEEDARRNAECEITIILMKGQDKKVWCKYPLNIKLARDMMMKAYGIICNESLMRGSPKIIVSMGGTAGDKLGDIFRAKGA